MSAEQPEPSAAGAGSAEGKSLYAYSAFVRSTKLGLGFIAVLLIGLVLFYPLLRKQEPGVRISFNTSSNKPPAPTMMKNPRFHGLDKDNQPYTLTADSASELSQDQIAFENPAGDMVMKNGQHLSGKAKGGMFDKNTHILTLNGTVEMQDAQGYKLNTEKLLVDTMQKSAATSTEVYGEGALGKLKAYGGAMVDGNSQQIIFEGPVFVTLIMDQSAKNNSKDKEKHP